MENSGRKLKVLLIHDTNFTRDSAAILGTSQLEACEVTIQVTDEISVKMPQLLSWKDTINLLQTWCGDGSSTEVNVDEPDLLLIDCHFDDDRSAPALHPASAGRTIDARGLLYGVVLAAYFAGRRPDKPFGFAVYSQELSAAADDPYAVTMFGLLEALAGFSNVRRPTEAIFRTRMVQTRGGKDPSTVLPKALENFRISLLRSFDYRAQPVIGTFQTARNELARVIAGDSSAAADLSVSWTTSDSKRETVKLKSLLADFLDAESRWIVKVCQKRKALEFLDSVLNDHNPETKLVKPVRAIVDAFEQGRVPKVWQTREDGYREKLVALIMVWALDRIKGNVRRKKNEAPSPLSIGDFEERLGLSPRVMNRALGRVLGNYDSTRSEAEPLYQGRELLQKLDDSAEWPFPNINWVRNIVRRELSRRLAVAGEDAWKLDRAHWPKCLQER